jgi:hypothetical protein
LIEQYVIKLISYRMFSLGTPVSSNNKTDRHDINEIVFKESLSIINLTKPIIVSSSIVDLLILLSFLVSSSLYYRPNNDDLIDHYCICYHCCDVLYDFNIKAMFRSSLSPVVCSVAHVLFMSFVIVCV